MNENEPTTTTSSRFGRAVFILGLLSLVASLAGASLVVPMCFPMLTTTMVNPDPVSLYPIDFPNGIDFPHGHTPGWLPLWYKLGWAGVLVSFPSGLVAVGLWFDRRRRSGPTGLRAGLTMAIIGASLSGLQLAAWIFVHTSPHVVKLTY